MKLPNVDKHHLIWALDNYGGLCENYLDLETGEIVSTELHDEQYEDSRYVQIEPIYPFESYTFMEEFTKTVKDTILRKNLQMAIKGKGAFGRFKGVLRQYPGENERWSTFRENKLEEYADMWLKDVASELQDQK
jgi:hypothetical protein